MILRLTNFICFYGYVGMVLGVGGSGMIIAAWELSRIFWVDLSSLSRIDHSTFVDQYRFLKAMEFTFGIFAVSYRKEIFTSRKANGVYLGGVFAGVTARAFSFPMDGRPRPSFIAFLALEAVCGIVAFVYSRRTLVTA